MKYSFMGKGLSPESLSYQNKDRHACDSPVIFCYNTDFLDFFSIYLCANYFAKCATKCFGTTPQKPPNYSVIRNHFKSSWFRSSSAFI